MAPGASGPLPALTPQTFLEFCPADQSRPGVQALLSAAIPLFVFLFARLLVNPWAGLTAAFLVACDPVHLTYTRQEMGEIPQTFWVMASLFFCRPAPGLRKKQGHFFCRPFCRGGPGY